MSVHDYTLFEQRREEILDVARECFAEKGFNATTMAEVARRARMSVGNLYNYFHGKAAIIESLAEREVKKLADEVGRLGETRPSREERIAHLRQIALDAMDIKRARVTLEIFAEAVHNEQLRQIVARIDNKMRELLAQMYRSYGHEIDPCKKHKKGSPAGHFFRASALLARGNRKWLPKEHRFTRCCTSR